jgi:hypothetical protein
VGYFLCSRKSRRRAKGDGITASEPGVTMTQATER